MLCLLEKVLVNCENSVENRVEENTDDSNEIQLRTSQSSTNQLPDVAYILRVESRQTEQGHKLYFIDTSFGLN